MTRIGIILGSTRPNRVGEQVAKWVLQIASKRNDAEFELVDLRDYPLPHLDEPLPALTRPVRERAHQAMGGQDCVLRRVRDRHARVQPQHLRRAEERN
jgi:NAD(P)H-dependent FMN reductase